MVDVDLTYSLGTVSVAADGTLVTGTGVLWTGINARQWDVIQIDPDNSNIVLPITSVDLDGVHLSIPEWKGGVKTNVPYIIYQTSPLRFVGGKAMADVDDMLAKLNTEGWYRYVNPIYAGPTEQGIVANEGQFALKYTTGQLWIMSGGAWVLVGVYKGFSPKGAWSNAIAYSGNDVVSYNGSSYIALQAGTNHLPTDTAYWQILASKGDTGPATLKPIVVWATATVFAPGPPADYVSINGSSYACTVAHTSGVFATDLAAGKWTVVASKGVDAPVYGGNSTTSLLIAVGSKAFTSQAGLAYQNGARVRASSSANTSNWMEGVATYSSTTLTIQVDKINGSGSFADWNFNIVGQPGAGDLSSANNLSDVTSLKTAYDNLNVHGADVASASTVNLDAATGVLLDVTGTTTITTITLSEGRERVVRFTGALTLTHGASLVLPGAANIITVAGAYAVFRGYASGVVRCTEYTPANGNLSVDPRVYTTAQQLQIRANINIGPGGYYNRVINPSGYNRQIILSSVADGTYTGFDQWLALTQSNPITPQTLSGGPNGIPFAMGMYQANATAQRMGWIQWLSAGNCIDLRGKTVTLSGTVATSISTIVRYAIVEWTGTADTITKDIVNNWTSTTFTAGNFFTSTSTTIVATGSFASTSVLTDVPGISGAISSSMNNLAVFFWTDSAQAQNNFLAISRVQLEVGSLATLLAFRSQQEEDRLCHYYLRVFNRPCLRGNVRAGIGPAEMALQLPSSMLKTPTLTVSSAISITSGATSGTITGITDQSATNNEAISFIPITTGSWPTAGLPCVTYGIDGVLVADARL